MKPRQPRRSSSLLIKFGAKNFETEHTSKFDEKYEMVEKLGEGNFGEVYHAKGKESGDERAVKILAKNLINEQEILIIKNEIQILRSVDHPNILKLYEVYEDDETYQIVTDMMRGGSLADDLEEKGTDERFGTLTEIDAAILMRQLLSCINYCHHNKIVHRDVKTENMMLEVDKALDHMKIIDFGLSTFFYDENPRFVEMCGTRDYMAPQVLIEDYGPKCDIWSCGVVLFEVLSGLLPFSDICSGDRNDMVTHDNIMNENYSFEDPIWNSISDSAKDFIKYLLTYEEKDRPTAEQALGHPFLKGGGSTSIKDVTEKTMLMSVAQQDSSRKIRVTFNQMDADGSGAIDKSELNGLLSLFETTLNEEELDEKLDDIMKNADADGDRDISYDEFVAFLVTSSFLQRENDAPEIIEEDASGEKKTHPITILAMYEKRIANNTEKGLDSNPHRSYQIGRRLATLR
jgi:calcium-dependent protein kinase